MKLHKLTKAATVLALAVTVGACDEGLTDLNQNPNAPRDAAPGFFLRHAIQQAASNLLGTGMATNHAGVWVQQVAQIQYADEDRYQPRADYFQALWDALYAGLSPTSGLGGALKDFDIVIEKAQEAENGAQEGVGLVMRAWTVGNMTDLWGDIPFSEALQGEEGNFTPAYDAQAAIYDQLFADLTRADQLLAAGGNTGFGAADLIYGGDAAQWRKFANSLRMRLAYHLVKVDAAKARQQFEAAAANPIFTSNADNAALTYTGESPNQNPIWVNENVSGRDDERISATMVNMLKSLNDPRLEVYADPIEADGVSYVGYGNGLPNNSLLLEEASRIGADFRAADAPAYFMTYAEVEFLLAEAARRGWAVPGTAAQHYAAGITAAMSMYGVESADITAYLAQPSVQYSAATGERQIAEQKWIALFMQGLEAWTNWRITGYPVITPGPAARAGGIPRRYEYPALESSVNQSSLSAAISRQGDVGLQSGRVWWDQ